MPNDQQPLSEYIQTQQVTVEKINQHIDQLVEIANILESAAQEIQDENNRNHS